MGEWKRARSEVAARYGVFDVHRHEVVGEDRVSHTIHTIETPDWCNVVPVTRDGRIVLIRLHRFGIQGSSLEIPGGMIDPGEDPLEAARRELLEETGYESERLVPLGNVYANPALQPTRLHMFLAEGCAPSEHGQRLEELEDCEVVLISPDELPDRLRRGEIGHALCWTALHAWGLSQPSRINAGR